MVLVSLIGEKLAKVNQEFVYDGPMSECRDCRLKTICFNLEEGKRYKVTGIRTVHHDCRVHQDGVRDVEVEQVPVAVGISQKLAIEGSKICLDLRPCRNLGCKQYFVCHPLGSKPSNKVKVVTLLEDIVCPDGDKRKKVLVE